MLSPIVDEGQSDSACLDNVIRTAEPYRPLIAPCNDDADPRSMGRQRSHGPGEESILRIPRFLSGALGRALLPSLLRDGKLIGAALDPGNGLRPSRFVVTKDDRVIMASKQACCPSIRKM